jgi:hypothetical protein
MSDTIFTLQKVKGLDYSFSKSEESSVEIIPGGCRWNEVLFQRMPPSKHTQAQYWRKQ